MLSHSKLAMIQAMLAAPMAIETLKTSDNYNPWQRKLRYDQIQTYVPKMVTASDKEIAEWNAKVEAKRKAKKSRR